jgi:hypothetical protein
MILVSRGTSHFRIHHAEHRPCQINIRCVVAYKYLLVKLFFVGAKSHASRVLALRRQYRDVERLITD